MKLLPLTDTHLLNSVLMHPSVLPFIVDEAGAIDAERIFAAGPVLGVWEQGELLGAFCFTQINPAVYEIHTNLLPGCRGKRGLEAARLAVLWLFANTMALRIITRVPSFNTAARRFATDSGMCAEYGRANAFFWGGRAHDVEFFALTLHSWVWHNANHFATAGAAFHEQIEAINTEQGLDTHADDFAHDAMVGAAISLHMATGSYRGVALYNEWAAVSGYAMLLLESINGDGSIILNMQGLRINISPAGVVSRCLTTPDSP